MDVAQLAERIGMQHGVEHGQARELVDDIFRALAYASHSGDDMNVPGVGRITISNDEPDIMDAVTAALDDLQTIGNDLLELSARMADRARRHNDEIGLDLARIRQTMAASA